MGKFYLWGSSGIQRAHKFMDTQSTVSCPLCGHSFKNRGKPLLLRVLGLLALL